VLPRGDGTVGHSVSIQRGAGVAAKSLLDEREMPLFVPAPRRPAWTVATYPGCLESWACQLPGRGTSTGARQAERRPQVSAPDSPPAGPASSRVASSRRARTRPLPILCSPKRPERLSKHFCRRYRATARTASQIGISKPRPGSLGWREVCKPRGDWG